MKRALLDARLRSAAKFVRAESVLADIGTDHGYLPVFLLSEGRVRRAILSDINEGPLSSARENAEASGLSHLCEFYLTDGCHALSGLGITDYAVCGMGGELIAEIIEHAPHLKDPAVRLILQPMSKQGHLASYLAKHGFAVKGESYSSEGGKFYRCICAEYDGLSQDISVTEAELGICPEDPSELPAYRGYLTAKLRSVQRAIRGKTEGGQTAHSEESLVKEISTRLCEIKDKED